MLHLVANIERRLSNVTTYQVFLLLSAELRHMKMIRVEHIVERRGTVCQCMALNLQLLLGPFLFIGNGIVQGPFGTCHSIHNVWAAQPRHIVLLNTSSKVFHCFVFANYFCEQESGLMAMVIVSCMLSRIFLMRH